MILFSKQGVLGLPLRMVVSIIVGGVALSTVLYFLSSSCIVPKELEVKWKPIVINNEKKNEITVSVFADGKAVRGANVIIMGLGNASSGKTDGEGEVTISFTPHMKGRNEGYVDIRVTAQGCYKSFEEEDAIKVV